MKRSRDSTKEESKQPPERWDRCHAFLTHKNRFCKQHPPGGKKYCGNHQHLEETKSTSSSTLITNNTTCIECNTATDASNSGYKKIPYGRKRIPCPIDGSHTIYAHNLKKHLRICPTAKRRKLEEVEPYFVRDVNCGGFGKEFTSSTSSSSFEPGTSLWAQRIALRVLRVYQSIFPAGSDRNGKNDDNNNNNRIAHDVSAITGQDIYDAIVLNDLSQAELDAGIVKGFRSHSVRSGGDQHTRQIASLVGHIRLMGFFKTTESVIILELGAGRGMFGLAAAGVTNAKNNGIKTHFIMVDKASSRSKADTAFRSIPKNAETSYIQLAGVNWTRVRCDLSHVDIRSVLNDDKYKEAKVVVIAKHLCGAGTDLALKSLEPVRDKVDACLLATCCHGICDYRHYVGRDVLRELMEGIGCDDEKDDCIPMFGAKEFDLLRRWSSATVASREAKIKRSVDGPKCARDDDAMDHQHLFLENNANRDSEKSSAINISSVVRQLNLSIKIQDLGRACQRLIDYGRLKYIQQNIFQEPNERNVVNLTHYVAANVTPQNAILWGRKTRAPSKINGEHGPNYLKT